MGSAEAAGEYRQRKTPRVVQVFENIFYREHILERTLSIENTFYRDTGRGRRRGWCRYSKLNPKLN